VELARNIQETGLIQPIIIQPFDKGPAGTKYRVVAGYRRFAAHQVNNASTIKAIIVPGLSDIDAKLLNLSENLNREELSLLQEANAVADLRKAGLSREEIGERLHKSVSWVAIRIYIKKLPEVIQKDIEDGWISSENVHALNQCKSDEERFLLVKQIKDYKLKEGKHKRIKVTRNSIRKDPDKAVPRDQKQIIKMNDFIIDTLGGNLLTRGLAWCAGYISTTELYEDLQAEADRLGKDFEIPTEDVSLL
jgi:ParB/RepB/Spo0J family partition protein